ncbi:MAG TPA: hypothetical protein VK892_07220, partial [Pyrinomonadaceae bacterium]|nr:hypothetical protein [Pyrinomonadaceae bacterium]
NENILKEGNKETWKSPFANDSGYPVDAKLPFNKYSGSGSFSDNKFLIAVVAVTVFSVFIIFVLYLTNQNNNSRKTFLETPTPYKIPTPPVTLPSATPEVDDRTLLEFGGKGTGAGLFEDPNEIAVDKAGNIYVSDDTKRVQRFDANGAFLNLWNVKGTKNETIDKIAADAEGNVFVLIGGEIVVFNGETGEQRHVLSIKRYIYDFILRDDGGLMLVAENNNREEIVQTDKGKRIVRRMSGIHSRAAEAQIDVNAIRLAIDGAGDFFAVCALDDVFGSHSYDAEDLMTFRFNPDGKFVNKFAPDLMPKAIAVDNQSRIYVLNGRSASDSGIHIFSNTGSKLKTVLFDRFEWVNAMSLDAQNNIYLIVGDKVRKLKAIEF